MLRCKPGGPASVADLLALPPEVVQRIDVRKDGGAAVYGFRSAHGVIEVTGPVVVILSEAP